PQLPLSVFLFLLLACAVGLLCFFFISFGARRDLPSFPTRRSSDLSSTSSAASSRSMREPSPCASSSSRKASAVVAKPVGTRMPRDRKSTRLNSSHVKISYAVFCLKKKKREDD